MASHRRDKSRVQGQRANCRKWLVAGGLLRGGEKEEARCDRKEMSEKQEETPLLQSHRLGPGPWAGDKETIAAEDGNPETEERAGTLQSRTRVSAGLVRVYRCLT